MAPGIRMRWVAVVPWAAAVAACGDNARSILCKACDATPACDAGERRVPGACLPIRCAQDQFWSPAADRCVACPAGETSAGGLVTACVPLDCGLDERWDAVARACVACRPGSFSPGGASVVRQSIGCDRDQSWDDGLRACVACDEGFVSEGGTARTWMAIACAPDQAWVADARACVACDEGARSPGGDVTDCVDIAASDPHMAMDGEGSVYTQGKKLSPSGVLLGTYLSGTSQFGIDFIGMNNDAMTASCGHISATTSGWACALQL
jgi:hypothetical protein